MDNTVTCVVYVDDCLSWAHSKHDIDKAMNYFKEDLISYNWEH